MHNGSYVILDGDLLPRDAAHIGIDDPGFLLGDGVFETLRLYGGVPFLIDAHMQRLAVSADAVQIEIPWSHEQLIDQITVLVERNQVQRAPGRVRVTATRGLGGGSDSTRATVLVTADPYGPPVESAYRIGVDVGTAAHARHAHPLHAIKSTSQQSNLQLRRQARQAGLFEMLEWNDAGVLAEGSTSNVFAVDADGVLHTPLPSDGCLRGVTRDAVLEVARGTGIVIREGHVTRVRVESAREIFLTNSLIEIVPVRQFDGRMVGSGAPGAVTRALHAAYRSLTGELRGT